MAGAPATFGTNALSRHARALAARTATYRRLANRPVGRPSGLGLARPPASLTSGAARRDDAEAQRGDLDFLCRHTRDSGRVGVAGAPLLGTGELLNSRPSRLWHWLG